MAPAVSSGGDGRDLVETDDGVVGLDENRLAVEAGEEAMNVGPQAMQACFVELFDVGARGPLEQSGAGIAVAEFPEHVDVDGLVGGVAEIGQKGAQPGIAGLGIGREPDDPRHGRET